MTEDRIAICQHPDGPGDYVPAEHVKDRCFMDCDCTPRVYVAVDSLLTPHEARAIRLALIFGTPHPTPPEVESAKAKIAQFENAQAPPRNPGASDAGRSDLGALEVSHEAAKGKGNE